MFGRDRRGGYALRQLLHPRNLQPRQLRRMGHHDPRLLSQRAEGEMVLVEFVDVIVVDRGGVLVQSQVIVVVNRRAVVGLVAAVEVQS